MFLRWHMHSIVRDFKAAESKIGKTKGNPWKSLTQQTLCAIKKKGSYPTFECKQLEKAAHAFYS